MDFNYQKAYFTLALPAYKNLNKKQKAITKKLLDVVGDLHQDRQLNIPLSEDIESLFDVLSCKEIAELSNAIYFLGHWYPGDTKKIFENKKGETWKVANICDQILRKRIQYPHNIQIHEGKFRVTFSNRNCWLWEEFGLAIEQNLEIYKNCNLLFDEKKLQNSAEKLKDICGDLWPDVNLLPDNKDCLKFLELQKIKKLEKLKQARIDKIESLKKKRKHIDIEISGFEWLVKNDIDIDNCIYYSHKDVFCFGWRQSLIEDKKNELAKNLKLFPFKFELK